MATRRSFIKLMATAGATPAVALARGTAKVVVVGGGFAGAACARALRKLDPDLDITVIASSKTFSACPFNSSVIAGLRDPAQQEFSYDSLAALGVKVATVGATAVDPAAKTVTLAGGEKLAWDRLVVAPGVDMNWTAIPGYTEAAAEKMPHAWTGGSQTLLLRRQLEAMDDGGLVVISAPATPYRCPPAPYERASLIAHYLKATKPKSKVLILDAKDGYSKQHLFEEAWAALYPGLIERVPLSKGGSVTSVDPATMTVKTDFEDYKAAVANIVPPQKAAAIAARAGVTDRTGWCPIEPVGFESTLQPGIHVLGDAALMGAMPKAAHAAVEQGKVCATAVVARLAGREAPEPTLDNICYSLAGPAYGFVEVNKYRPEKGQLLAVPGAVNTSPVRASVSMRAQEASEDEAWFRAVTAETFG
ncbi:FCSD flavin-binding domain-containing protein [Reyranella sp.]|uniref:FCSD flavin-binding domain-containing protein n=1 Tax=Reyranella sp. TaxID=1929291 RepID=UPI003D103FB5